MKPYETEIHRGCRVNIYRDDDPVNPRTDFDNCTTLILFHGRYKLGDEHSYKETDFDSWSECRDRLVKDYRPVGILPVYLYDHSGIAVSTEPFSCPWDSGQIGYALVSTAQAAAEGYTDLDSPKLTAWAEGIIRGDLETYNSFISGDVWGFRVDHGDESDSVWGFYGLDYVKAEARAVAEGFAKDTAAEVAG